MTFEPLYIVDEIGQIVANTATAILATIQANETAALGRTNIETINYQKGHRIELIQTLIQMDKDPASQMLRYPLVYLVQDFTERRGKHPRMYAEVNLTVIIAHYTEQTRKVDDRYTKVFKPVLYPIYYELINQISLYGGIAESLEQDIPHNKTDRLFWGTQPAGGAGKNMLTDFVDAIEINNLNLNFYFKYC